MTWLTASPCGDPLGPLCVWLTFRFGICMTSDRTLAIAPPTHNATLVSVSNRSISVPLPGDIARRVTPHGQNAPGAADHVRVRLTGEMGFRNASRFCGRSRSVLAALPPGFRYGIEIRNSEYLVPDYPDVLRRHNVAHVFNYGTRMPPLDAQAMREDLWTVDFAVCRALLRPGRDNETAVDTFEPYTHVQQEYPEARDGLCAMIDRGPQIRNGVYVYVNNRLEGNAPGTIRAVVD
ncbi:MAG: DUF72 domain-containing protein [Acidobacteriota bacterium]